MSVCVSVERLEILGLPIDGPMTDPFPHNECAVAAPTVPNDSDSPTHASPSVGWPFFRLPSPLGRFHPAI